MKKVFSLLLFFALTFSLLTGCGNGAFGFYKVTVTGWEDILAEPLKNTYRAGTVVQIKADSVTDLSVYVYVNGERIPVIDHDMNFWYYEFVMPEKDTTVHLTSDEFYGQDEYKFDDVHWWLRSQKDVHKVSIRTENHEEEKGFIENRYSSKQTDIDNFKAIADQWLLRVDDDATKDTTHSYTYTFYYTDRNSSSLYFNDAFSHWNDFSSYATFRFKDPNYALPTIEDPDLITYSFPYGRKANHIKRYDTEYFTVNYTMDPLVEFVPYSGEEPDVAPTFYLDSDYGIINLLSPTLFELNGEYYEIVSGENHWAYRDLKPFLN